MAQAINRAVVVGGRGAVGELFRQALAAQVPNVGVIDTGPSPATGNYAQCDAARPTAEARALLAAADVAVVALPEASALTALPTIFAELPDAARLVDTLSVKTEVCALYAELAPRQQVLSLNPMFAPSLGFAGQGAIIVPVAPGPRAAWFCDLLTAAGCRLVEMTAAEHDRATAGLQVLTHAAILATGLGLANLGHDVARLAPVMPPPHRALLGLLARITTAAPETYRDIQAGNSHATAARQALTNGLRDLSATIDDPAAFAALFDRLAAFLGDTRDPLAHDAARWLNHRP